MVGYFSIQFHFKGKYCNGNAVDQSTFKTIMEYVVFCFKICTGWIVISNECKGEAACQVDVIVVNIIIIFVIITEMILTVTIIIKVTIIIITVIIITWEHQDISGYGLSADCFSYSLELWPVAPLGILGIERSER